MPSRTAVIVWSLAGLAIINLIAGCQSGGNGDSPDGASGDMVAHAAAANAASQTLEQAIAAGTPTQEAIDSLVQTLSADPRVIVAVAGEDGQSAWALFSSGLEYVFDVVDEAAEWAQLATVAPKTRAPAAAATGARRIPAGQAGVSALRVSQADAASDYVLPAGNQAVLANSLYKTLRLQDVRLPVQMMLEACGYEVQVVDADLEFFKNLSAYGVIFIEAHGSERKSVEQVWDSAASTFYNTVLGQGRPFCGLTGGEAVLQSSTEVTTELINAYKDDLECGRLKIRCPTVRRAGIPVTYRFFAVTPNFIRHHDKGTFPEGALLCLSSCRAFVGEESPWAELMAEKSTGAVVVGWNARVHFDISARAMLHLFQFLAGTNEQFAITDTNSQTGVKTISPLLFQTDAPVLPQTVELAMAGLIAKSFDRDPQTQAQLTGSGDALYGWPRLMLAPAIETFESRGDGKVELAGRCADNAELRFADGEAVNIGTASDGLWTFSLPGLYSGPMALCLQDRCCPARDLLSWNPVVIKVRPASPVSALGVCNFEVTYRLIARAVAAGNRAGWLVWDLPDFAFSAKWDVDGSVVTWSISGNATVPDDLFGPSQCTWTGGNSRAFNEVAVSPDSTGELVSYDGRTAYLTVYPPFDLDYSATCSGLTPPTYACGIAPAVNVEVQLGQDWSILAGSTTDLFGQYTIEWQACTPQPAFESNRLPR